MIQSTTNTTGTQDTVRHVCVCSKYNEGRPHEVSNTTLYRHIREASTEEEKQRIHSVMALGGIVPALENFTTAEQPLVQASGSAWSAGPASEVPLRPSTRRAATVRGLIARAREHESLQHVGRRKRARLANTSQIQSDMEMEADPVSTHIYLSLPRSSC
jgi:hypothetical protein